MLMHHIEKSISKVYIYNIKTISNHITTHYIMNQNYKQWCNVLAGLGRAQYDTKPSFSLSRNVFVLTKNLSLHPDPKVKCSEMINVL